MRVEPEDYNHYMMVERGDQCSGSSYFKEFTYIYQESSWFKTMQKKSFLLQGSPKSTHLLEIFNGSRSVNFRGLVQKLKNGPTFFYL